MTKISCNFNFDAIRKRLNSSIDKRIDQYVAAYKRAGKQFVDRARSKTREENGFGNITWNLRSSIGYILVLNHQRIDSYFPTMNGGAEGSKNGLAYASEIASLIDDGGLILVCVAGMSYAAAVEDTGKDVITGSDQKFKEFLTTELKAVV